MTNKEKFVEIFKRDPITSERPIYCNGKYGATKCPYDQPGCIGSWWDKEYEESTTGNQTLCADCNFKMDEVRRAYDKVVTEGHVLDKIRAEVESIENHATNNGYDFWLRTPDEIKKDVLAIIDKYKAETEET